MHTKMNNTTTKKRLKHIELLYRLLPYIYVRNWRINIRIILSIICTLLVIFLNIATPLLLRMIIDLFWKKSPYIDFTSTVLFLLVTYVSLWTFSKIFNELREIILFRVFERGIRLMSIRLFEKLHSLTLSFHLDRKTGSITGAVDRIHKAVPEILWSLVIMIPTIIEILFAMAILWYLYGVSYGIALLLILFSSLLFSLVSLYLIFPAQKYSVESSAKSQSFVVDSILNFETVKLFNNKQYEVQQCDLLFEQREDASTRLYVQRGLVGLGQNIILGIGLLYVTLKSGNGVISGLMSVGDFIVINNYMQQFVTPVNYFSYFIRQMWKGIGDLENAINLLQARPEIENVPHAQPLVVGQSVSIVFDNVSFGYNARGLILKNLSFNIPSEKMIAFVGSTGAGKSTISRLLFRFYEVTSGRILLNNQNIRLVTQESLRKIIGIVPQETMLFHNTLYYNIAYGRPSATKQEVERAIKLAELDHLINILPDGYNSIVGERGLKLSGGEKQRIAIARVILKNPKIFIFDEATSALDSMTEQKIQSNLETVAKGSTTVIIAHRLATVIRAHEIIVLDQGKIVQRGTHEALIKDKTGTYARLWERQMTCTE